MNQKSKWVVVAAFILFAYFLAQAAHKAKGQESIAFEHWTAQDIAQIHRYYYPISPTNNSEHWHDWDCCGSQRCFPARANTVKWTPDGIRVTLPDGSVEVAGEADGRWKARTGGLNDFRDHICLESTSGVWRVRCGYRGAPRT